MESNHHKMMQDDYEGNSPSQNDNEKGYGNADYMGELNTNNQYFKNYSEDDEDEQEGQLYAQNVNENRQRHQAGEYQEDQSMDEEDSKFTGRDQAGGQRRMEDSMGDMSEDEDSKFVTENPAGGQRYMEEEDSEGNISEGGNHVLNDEKEEDDDGEGDDMGYDKDGDKEGESDFEKSANQGNEEEGDDEDMEQIDGTKKVKMDKGEVSVSGQEGEGDKKEGEEQDKKEDNEEEVKQEGERKEDEEKKEGKETGEPERRKGGRIPNRLKVQQMQNQVPVPGMSEEERLIYAMDSARRFNTRILGNRPRLQGFMKQMEKNREKDITPIELNGVTFPSAFVPVYMYDTSGNEYFSMNQSAQVERAPMGKFKRMNIDNEGVTLVPEQFNLLKMEPGKRFQRKRKRRPPVIKPEDSD